MFDLTVGFFFLPAPGIFVCRDGFGRNIEEPPFLPFKQGWLALAIPLIPQLSTKLLQGLAVAVGAEADATWRSNSLGVREMAAIPMRRPE